MVIKNSEHTPDSILLYSIGVSGQLDDDFTAAFCPPGTHLESDGECTILAGIRADQSGILGLLRQLHNLGCAIRWMRTLPDKED